MTSSDSEVRFLARKFKLLTFGDGLLTLKLNRKKMNGRIQLVM